MLAAEVTPSGVVLVLVLVAAVGVVVLGASLVVERPERTTPEDSISLCL